MVMLNMEIASLILMREGVVHRPWKMKAWCVSIETTATRRISDIDVRATGSPPSRTRLFHISGIPGKAGTEFL